MGWLRPRGARLALVGRAAARWRRRALMPVCRRRGRGVFIGVRDRNYKVTGKAPAMTIQRDDLTPAEYGLQWGRAAYCRLAVASICLFRGQAPSAATRLAALRVCSLPRTGLRCAPNFRLFGATVCLRR